MCWLRSRPWQWTSRLFHHPVLLTRSVFSSLTRSQETESLTLEKRSANRKKKMNGRKKEIKLPARRHPITHAQTNRPAVWQRRVGLWKADRKKGPSYKNLILSWYGGWLFWSRLMNDPRLGYRLSIWLDRVVAPPLPKNSQKRHYSIKREREKRGEKEGGESERWRAISWK